MAQGWCISQLHVCASKVVYVSDFLFHLDEKSPPGWQPPQVFLIVIQSIRVIVSHTEADEN